MLRNNFLKSSAALYERILLPSIHAVLKTHVSNGVIIRNPGKFSVP